jgi:hypothetical protein
MSPELAALFGTALGSAGTLLVTWFMVRAEERKNYRSLVFQAGIENFKQACEMARRNGGAVMPLEDYIIHISSVTSLLANKKKIDLADLDELLSDSEAFARKISEFRSRQDG